MKKYLFSLFLLATSLLFTEGLIHPKFKRPFFSPSTLSSSIAEIDTDDNNVKEKAVVVGGGPIGLASAITLAKQGYDVSVFESTSSEDMRKFDPSRAFMYNINSRGQTFTKMYPQLIHEKLVERSIASDKVSTMVASSNLKEKIKNNDAMVRSVAGGNISYWVSRHEMNLLLWDAVDEHNLEKTDKNFGKILFEQGMKCIDVVPVLKENEDEEGEQILQVVLEDVKTGKQKLIKADLVVAADGFKSKVRDCLLQKQGLFSKWSYNPKKFQIKKYTSPATGLRLKALQVPTKKFVMTDVDGTIIKTKNPSFTVAKSTLNGYTDRLSLGCLPIKEDHAIRPANAITRPKHILWDMKTGKEVKEFYKKSFGHRIQNFDDLINDEEWDRFAKSEGLYFPPCQYSPGLQVSDESGNCGVVLLGDSAHSFSPDIGQGINAGLTDVLKFGETLALAKEKKKQGDTLGKALKEYERVRAPETRSLIKIARFGAPYQYGQSLLKDRIGKQLWFYNVILRMLLNKITFSLFPKPMIFMVNDINLTYRQVRRRADLGTAALLLSGAAAIMKLCLKKSFISP